MRTVRGDAGGRVLATCLLLVASGCAGLEPGDVQRSWNGTMRQLGINPIYPPREDVQPGDVYVRRGNPNDASLLADRGYVPIDLWVANVASGAALRDFYAQRSLFPAMTVPPQPQTPAPAPAPAGPATAGSAIIVIPKGVPPEATHQNDVFTAGGIKALRQVAFPDFASMSVTGGNLRAFLPIEALSLAFGAEWEDVQQLDVRIPLAESCGLPADRLLARIARPDASGLVLDNAFLSHQALDALKKGHEQAIRADQELTSEQKQALLADGSLYLDVVSEVYYARTIDLSISRQSAFGTRAELKPLVSPAAKTSQPPAAAPAAEAPAAEEAEQEPRLDAFAAAREINTKLSDVGKLQAPGGALQFTSVSAHSIGMRRTYERPIAIGYRGLLLAVDPSNGRIVGSAAVSHGKAVTTAGEDLRARIAAAIRAELGVGAGELSSKPQTTELTLTCTDAVMPRVAELVDKAETRLRIATAVRTELRAERKLDAAAEAMLKQFEATAPRLERRAD